MADGNDGVADGKTRGAKFYEPNSPENIAARALAVYNGLMTEAEAAAEAALGMPDALRNSQQ